MRIGVFFPSVEHVALDAMVERIAMVAARGFSSAWLPQSVSFDALTLLAVAGRSAPRIELGVAVVPTFPRHPMVTAAQALTANAAVGGRLVLGLGLSHQETIEERYGLSYERPARHMDEYLALLMPLLAEQEVDHDGATLAAHGSLRVPDATACPVLLAALAPRMLALAGGRADGVVTWCTGPATVEQHIVPRLFAAAREAGRPTPRVVVALPCCVTDDVADGRVKAGEQLPGYADLPAYRAVLDREGAAGPADVAVVGDEASVRDQLERFAAIGTTDFVAVPCGSPQDRDRTLTHLAGLVAR